MENNSSLDSSVLSSIKKIPSILKTICVLTFIGVGIMNFIGPVYNYFNIDKNIAKLEQTIKKLEDSDNQASVSTLQDALDISYKARSNKTINLLVDILAGILCIIGAVLMMRLNKNGFFVYTIGELLPIIFHYVIFGFGNGTLAILTSAFSVVIPLAFIILYAIQLKEMD